MRELNVAPIQYLEDLEDLDEHVRGLHGSPVTSSPTRLHCNLKK